MRDWLSLLGGLIIWAAHFFTLYGIAEFGGHGAVARLLIISVTLVCLIAEALLLRSTMHQTMRDDFARWRIRSTQAMALLGAIAILWQAFPIAMSR